MIEAKANGSAQRGGRAPGGEEATAENGALSSLAISNLAFAEDLYYQFLRDPSSVDPAWRATFQALDGARAGNGVQELQPPAAFARSIFAPAPGATPAAGNAVVSRTSVRLLSERVQRLVEGYRELGHLGADLDPLGLVKRD